MRTLTRVICSIVVILCLGDPALLAQGPDHKKFQIHPDMSSDTHPQVAVRLGAEKGNGPTKVGPNVQVNAPQQAFPHGLLGRSETTIAASNSGKLLVAGFNDAQGFCGPPFGAPCTPESPAGLSGFSFSTDGGLTWTDGGAPDPALSPGGNVFTRGDPWMDRGGSDDATFYYSNIAVDSTTGAALGVSVHRGHFSGKTFGWEDVRVFNAPNAQNQCQVFGAPAGTLAPCDGYDKDAMTAAKDGSGAAYVSITNFKAVCGFAQFGFGQIEVWRTHDGGNSWQGPTIAAPDLTFITDPSNPDCGLTGTVQQGSAPAIGPKGEVYVTWLAGPTFTGPGGSVESTNANIEVAVSLDGGVTFGSGVTVASINVSELRTSPAGYNRGSRLDSPRIAVAATGSNHGRVYVTFTSETSPAPIPGPVPCPSGLPAGSFCLGQDPLSEEAFISFSDDQGLTWSTPTPLAAPVPPMGVKRMWPVPSVEPGGNVDVVYYESQETSTPLNPECVVSLGAPVFRVGPANSLVDTFLVRSDGGQTFSAPVKVTTVTSNWCTTHTNIFPNFGDYIGGTSGATRALPVWADGRNDVPDTFFDPIK